MLPSAPVVPTPEHGPDEVRRALDRVLSRPELRPDPESLLERLREWVLDQLGRAADALLQGGAGSLLGWLVVALLVAGAAAFGLRLARGLRPDPSASTATPVRPARSSSEWLADAREREARGEWRGALRCRYRALVAALAEAGVVDDVPGRTSGEHRSAVGRAAPAAAGGFAAASELYELAWYGRRPTGAAESAAFDELASRVLREATP